MSRRKIIVKRQRVLEREFLGLDILNKLVKNLILRKG